MSKLGGLACIFMFVIPIANPQVVKFTKYKKVETYEVRPGILMMPRYSEDGQVCLIELQRRLYSPEQVSVSPSLLPDEIDQIINELVPAREKGPRPKNLLEQGTTDFIGSTMVTDEEYENISIRIYGEILHGSKVKHIVAEDVVATIQWKNRKCQ
jgi:hypothetical protein